MNPRIKELAEQVGAGFNEGFYREIVGITMSPDKLEKFAELIVRQCMIIGFNAVYHVEDNSNAVSVYDHIKEHFGVDA